MKHVYFNSSRLLGQNVMMSVDDPWLRFGDATFETVRLLDGRPLWWHLHRSRLIDGIERCGLDSRCLAESLDSDVLGCVESSGVRDGALRVYVAPPTAPALPCERLVVVEHWEPPEGLYERGVTLALTDVPHPRDGAYGKSASRRWAQNARRTMPSDVDDVIFCIDGLCAESTTASLLWLRDGQWYCVDPALGVLRSTSIDALRECGVDVCVGQLPLDEAGLVDSMILVSSLRVAVGVRRFGDFVCSDPDALAAPLRRRLLGDRLN